MSPKTQQSRHVLKDVVTKIPAEVGFNVKSRINFALQCADGGSNQTRCLIEVERALMKAGHARLAARIKNARTALVAEREAEEFRNTINPNL